MYAFRLHGVLIASFTSLILSTWPCLTRADTCLPSPGTACVSDIFQITDGHGNVLTDANGNLASVTLVEGGDEGSITPIIFEFPFSGVISNAGEFVGLTEGLLTDANGNFAISDSVSLFSIRLPLGNPGIAVSFFSDTEIEGTFDACTGVATGGACIPETGAVQDLTALAFPGGTAPFHILMQSDPSEVPEPGTLPLLGFGFACLAAVGARRRHV